MRLTNRRLYTEQARSGANINADTRYSPGKVVIFGSHWKKTRVCLHFDAEAIKHGDKTHDCKVATTVVETLSQMEFLVYHLLRCPVDAVEQLHGHCDQGEEHQVQLNAETSHCPAIVYICEKTERAMTSLLSSNSCYANSIYCFIFP